MGQLSAHKSYKSLLVIDWQPARSHKWPGEKKFFLVFCVGSCGKWERNGGLMIHPQPLCEAIYSEHTWRKGLFVRATINGRLSHTCSCENHMTGQITARMYRHCILHCLFPSSARMKQRRRRKGLQSFSLRPPPPPSPFKRTKGRKLPRWILFFFLSILW